MNQSAMQAYSWDDLYEGLVVGWKFQVTAGDMDAFARLSGDTNPLHIDAEFARAKGFKDRVVYGALLAAQVSRLVGMNLPGRDAVLVGMAVHFNGAAMIDDVIDFQATLTGKSEATRLLSLKFAMRCERRLIAKGTAEALLRDG